jgi:hypothetical protein
MLGYEARWIHPEGCYSNPDAMNMYLIYGWPDGMEGYDTFTASWMGTTAYLCGSYVEGYYQQSSQFQSCRDKFGGDCWCAWNTVGSSSCLVREEP